MADETSIANLALAKLGISPIMALTDDSKQAQFANRFYGQSREEVLAARDWTFAIKRQSLNRLAAAPASEWLYAYQLPADHLRLVQFNEDEIVSAKHRFALEGNTLVTDASTVTVCYVANITDATLFSPLFVETLATKLAAELSGPLTGSREMGAMFYELYAKLLSTPQAGETLGRTKRTKGASLSATDIANAALSLLGVSPISSFTDTSVQAQLVDRLYDQTRDEVLAVRPWTFAIKRVSPTGTTNAAGSEWARTYTLPTDYLRLVQIDDDDVESIQHKYALEGKSLLTDYNPVEICYVARITDVSFYSPLFIEAFTYKLATKLAGPLSQGGGVIEALAAAYEKALVTPQVGESVKRTKRQKSATLDVVEISNAALALIGIGPIASLSDASVQAQLCDRLYERSRDEVLEARAWPFAVKRATLTPVVNAAGSEYSRSYTLPNDFVRLLQINDDEVATIRNKYTVEGTTLLTDAASVEIVYIHRATNAALYNPAFVEALSYKLAIKLLGALAPDKSSQLLASLQQSYETAIAAPYIGEQTSRTNRVKSATIDAVEISNMALGMLGISPILSLSDPSVQAQMADRFYAPTRDELLSMHRWNFAMRRAALTKATPAPSFEWSFAYTLPANCLRVVQLNGYEPTEPLGEFAIENNQLLTDADPAEARYILRVTDTTAYPMLFVNALATLLASRMAPSLGVAADIVVSLDQKFSALTGPRARMSDVFEEQRRLKPAWAQSGLINARFTRYPYGV